MERSPRRGDRRRDDASSAGLGSHRLRVVLLVLTIFVAPLTLAISYIVMRDSAFRPPFDEQPGGSLSGRITLPGGAPAADQPVQVLLHVRDRAPELHADVRTDESGVFAVDVPPLDGCYAVVAGGGEWIAISREVTLAGGEPDLDFALQPGCELVLTLSRTDGRAIRGGEYELAREGRAFGFSVPSDAFVGTFEGATIQRGGLPPGSWTLRFELDDGTEGEVELELEPGRIEIALDPF